MKALIITGQGVQDQEFIYPLHRLNGAGWTVDVAVRGGAKCTGIQGVKIEPTRDIPLLAEVNDYDLLVIPGGVKAMEHMRLDGDLMKWVREFAWSSRHVIASICSGAQMLISARLCKGRRISAYYAMRVDVENAGAEFVDAPAVVSDNIVTSPHYKYLGPWMEAVLAEAAARA